MARDYVVYLRLNVKQDLRLLYSCVPYRINLDMTIFLKKISSTLNQNPHPHRQERQKRANPPPTWDSTSCQ